MSSSSSIKKNKLADWIKAEGFKLCFSCDCCTYLYKLYFKLLLSNHCNKCVKAGSLYYIIPESSFSNTEWKHLMKVQNSLKEEEEVVLAKLLYL